MRVAVQPMINIAPTLKWHRAAVPLALSSRLLHNRGVEQTDCSARSRGITKYEVLCVGILPVSQKTYYRPRPGSDWEYGRSMGAAGWCGSQTCINRVPRRSA